MEAKELYRGLKQLQERGEIGNAYSGCGSIMSELNDILDCFYEYILEKYGDAMPLWAETFVQIYSWQFQTLHECASAYYENFYGCSDYQTIIKVADYLRKNGYHEIAEPYVSADVDCERYQYPTDKVHLLPDDWIDNNDEAIWNFYVDLLERHKEELVK